MTDCGPQTEQDRCFCEHLPLLGDTWATFALLTWVTCSVCRAEPHKPMRFSSWTALCTTNTASWSQRWRVRCNDNINYLPCKQSICWNTLNTHITQTLTVHHSFPPPLLIFLAVLLNKTSVGAFMDGRTNQSLLQRRLQSLNLNNKLCFMLAYRKQNISMTWK